MPTKKDKINNELTIDWDWVKSEIIKEIIMQEDKKYLPIIYGYLDFMKLIEHFVSSFVAP